MKTIRLVLISLGLAGTLVGADAEPITAVPTPTNVVVQTTVSELASGYAAAVSQMSLKSLVIYFQGDGKIVSVRGIRSTKALGGVLLVTFSSGDMLAINAERIVLITDGTRSPQG
ncbi:hypothetical protein ESB00_07875 [Oleiharenicola lentus]|jgi:hypothetical protein|uniref:Uncharacterized protein n=1 Tax=Oleiharenicola lentus TaxID=2508720 RepID=A0A4Q1CAB1_9BACT|nr:hypothetical protein [Oleiharenicola lentus]RXK55792.1 hypothetical protein ESB00_07875 [Oleiharenicola lentus]